mmetsp:Transcript_22203/g.37992  ORF Transcript_22203/g.37992 Transcript_22203/m.37992 type:complete len:85 (-) Transcript_22203:371-625(-)
MVVFKNKIVRQECGSTQNGIQQAACTTARSVVRTLSWNTSALHLCDELWLPAGPPSLLRCFGSCSPQTSSRCTCVALLELSLCL